MVVAFLSSQAQMFGMIEDLAIAQWIGALTALLASVILIITAVGVGEDGIKAEKWDAHATPD
jgi:hypothetical protein